MPKVREGYLEEKRKEILKAAFKVCMRKPAYELTMSDIVAETGMSQGGVYKYFDNIISVYAALIDEANQRGDRKERIDEINASDLRPEVKLRELFSIAESFLSDMLISYNKILFELDTLYLQDPKLGKKIYARTTTTPVFQHLAGSVSGLITAGVSDGCFKPVVPVQDILAFIVSSFDGIIRDVTLSKCYNESSDHVSAFDEKKLIDCLYLSTMTLLGKSPTHSKRKEKP